MKVPVSVVIISKNEEEHIANCIKSVQNWADEIIVVDDESTDRTAEIAKQYCQVISAPRGKLNARHAGIEYASGDIIVSCDADCYYPPNWLNLLLRHFYNPEVVAVCGPHLQEGNLLQIIGSVWYNNLFPLAKQRINGANSAFLKEAYYKVGCFDLSIDQFDREQIVTEEEIVFFNKLTSIGKVIFDLQACCFAPIRGRGKRFYKEYRPETKYQKEVLQGERF